MDWVSFSFRNVEIGSKVIGLKLKRAFNTAHSSSTVRNNFVFRLKYQGIIACGQCGLPPKKALVYLADTNDCKEFFSLLSKELKKKSQNRQQAIIKSVLSQVPEELFPKCRKFQLNDQHDRNTMIDLFEIIEVSQTIKRPEFKAAISALQFAIFDLLAKIYKQSLSTFIFSKEVAQKHKANSFYTISYEQDIKSMVQNAVDSLQYTHYIKIKFIDQIDKLFHLLLQLQTTTKGMIKGYIIDANASWKVQSFRYFNEKVMDEGFNSFNQKILYVEQPFPVSFQGNQYQEWKEMKMMSRVDILADQSFADEYDVETVYDLAYGVNIKTEKAGGLLKSIRSATVAKEKGLQVIFGSMVSTHLGSSQTYSLYPLSKLLDVDGSLLVQEPQVSGGFQWAGQNQLIHAKQSIYGLQIDYSFLQS